MRCPTKEVKDRRRTSNVIDALVIDRVWLAVGVICED
jgi:hypothetical protein